MDAILNSDPVLEEMERDQHWEKTIDYCCKNWADNRSLESLLRLMLQAWFLCSYADDLPPFHEKPPADIDYDKLTQILEDTLTEGDLRYNEEAAFLCLSGQMMTAQPEWFVNHDNSYDEIKRRGSDKMKHACSLDPIFCSFYQDKSISEEEASLLFPGKSEVDCYIKSIITSTWR